MRDYDFGMIGLGVMGQNLLFNMADKGFSVIGYDKLEEKALALESGATANTRVKGVTGLQEMIDGLSLPRRIMMLVPAGKIVDDVIAELLPLLVPGDIVIDAGNSFYKDTIRRVQYLKEHDIHFMGMGISGGEKGARYGASLMPGGDRTAYNHVHKLLKAVAAEVNGEACTAYMGNGAAGHYVKMVHNGIEYAMMQIISEVYDILKNGLQLHNHQIHEVFKKWNEGRLQSYLVQITADIFLKKDEFTSADLVDMILDKAGSKGTGKWTSQEAMDIYISIPTIDTAVSMRMLSWQKDERVLASKLYAFPATVIDTNDQDVFIDKLEDALYVACIICYAQGLTMLQKASAEYSMDIPLKDVVKIWRGGCIIRSLLLEDFYQAFVKDNDMTNILLDKNIAYLISPRMEAFREVVAKAVMAGIASGGLQNTLAYIENYASEKMPTNLIQAQRDYFGAHQYERIDREGMFHTDWDSLNF